MAKEQRFERVYTQGALQDVYKRQLFFPPRLSAKQFFDSLKRRSENRGGVSFELRFKLSFILAGAFRRVIVVGLLNAGQPVAAGGKCAAHGLIRETRLAADPRQPGRLQQLRRRAQKSRRQPAPAVRCV